MKSIIPTLITMVLLTSSLVGCKQNSSKKLNQTLSKLDSLDIENNRQVKLAGENITKAYIYMNDSILNLWSDIRSDYRFFGYEKADTLSKRLIFFSVFTNDVKNNPFNCKLGAYYSMPNRDKLLIKYEAIQGAYIKTIATNKKGEKTILYFEEKWVEFETE
jgi:hypothetical protein